MGHVDPQDQKKPSRLKRALGSGSPRLRSVVIAAGVIGVVAAPVGVAATGSVLKEGVRNGTAVKETEIISSAPSTTAKTGGYATRQSNLSSTGGGAIYGCRTGEGGSAAKPPQNPCLRANNLEKGYAFEFNATKGPIVGLISASGNGGDSVKPFVTNATGVATGLNADRVDGQNAADIAKTAFDASTAASAKDATDKANGAKTRWALVNEKGVIEEQSGGFTIASAYEGANDNVYINTGATAAGHGLSATIAAQNQVDVDGTTGADPNFGGEVSVSRCAATVTTTDCAPAAAKNDNTIVVAPRKSDGSATTATTRKRFYVEITG